MPRSKAGPNTNCKTFYHLKFVVGFRAVAEGQDVISDVSKTVSAKADQGPPRKLIARKKMSERV